MTASKKSAEGENPPPRAALPKKTEAAKSAPKAKARASVNPLIDRASRSVKPVSREMHPGHSLHRHGHNEEMEIRILSYNFQDDSEVENGAGMYAVAYWAKFLQERVDSAAEGSRENSAGFLRGLTHR
ncbi:unannotated protein [freshwater metagenome]|uniref:Unannotated protein n=1 Tax=freshwater metagenome TaxID=449393 RepID=A0A6J7PZ27_9ZZZZ